MSEKHSRMPYEVGLGKVRNVYHDLTVDAGSRQDYTHDVHGRTTWTAATTDEGTMDEVDGDQSGFQIRGLAAGAQVAATDTPKKK